MLHIGITWWLLIDWCHFGLTRNRLRWSSLLLTNSSCLSMTLQYFGVHGRYYQLFFAWRRLRAIICCLIFLCWLTDIWLTAADNLGKSINEVNSIVIEFCWKIWWFFFYGLLLDLIFFLQWADNKGIDTAIKLNNSGEYNTTHR